MATTVSDRCFSMSMLRVVMLIFAMVDMVISLTPVVLVPGIGMSQLAVRNLKTMQVKHVWAITNRDHRSIEFNQLEGVWDPVQSEFVSILNDSVIFVPTDDYGLFAVRNLNANATGIISHLSAYMENLIDMLLKEGYKPGYNLFAFPYDWRQSCRFHGTAFRQFLDYVSSAYNPTVGPRERINIISHSMGNMVVRSSLVENRDHFEQFVNKWISVAPPNQGAGGNLLREVLQGFNDYDFFVNSKIAHGLGAALPSIYELLPTSYFPFRDLASIGYTLSQGQKFHYQPSNYSTVFDLALRGFSIHVNGVKYDKEFNLHLWNYTLRTRELWRTANLPSSVQYTLLYGINHKTANSVQFVHPLESPDQMRTSRFQFDYVNGDGTVPQESAVNDLFGDGANIKREAVHETHYGLIRHTHVLNKILCYLSDRKRLIPCHIVGSDSVKLIN